MIIQFIVDGKIRPCFPGEVICPWGRHYHSGDEIEIELEMILCRHKAEVGFVKETGMTFSEFEQYKKKMHGQIVRDLRMNGPKISFDEFTKRYFRKREERE